MLQETLETFARETKHKRIVSDEQLLKKLIATQAPKFVDWEGIYQYVANDFSRREYLAPKKLSKYANYSIVPFSAIQSVFVGQPLPDNPTFQHFLKTVNPPASNALALFFAGNCFKTSEFIAAINDRKLYDRVCGYSGPSTKTVTQDIGNMIAKFDFRPVLSDVYVSEESQYVEKLKDNVDNFQKERSKEPLVFAPSTPKAWTVDTEREFRNLSNLIKYREEKDLPTQTRCAPLIVEMLINETDKTGIVNILDYCTEECLNEMIALKQSEDYYTVRDWKKSQHQLTKPEFLKELIIHEPVGPDLEKKIQFLEINKIS